MEGEEREGERKKERSSSCQTTQKPSFHDQASNEQKKKKGNFLGVKPELTGTKKKRSQMHVKTKTGKCKL